MTTKTEKSYAMDKMKASFSAGQSNRKGVSQTNQAHMNKPEALQKIRVVCSTGNGCAS